MRFWDKFDNNLLTLEDQKEALTKPGWSYRFARANIPGSNFKALQAKACEDPWYAYKFARDVPGADKKYCFKHAYPEYEYGPDKWKSEYNKYTMRKACE